MNAPERVEIVPSGFGNGQSARDAAELSHRYDFEADLDHTVKQLHGTVDTVLPAVRADRSRRLFAWLSRSSIKLNLILATALLASVLSNFVLGWYAVHPVREYFASDNGRIFPMIPLGHPYRKPADVIQYAKETVERSFTLDFVNWRAQLEDVRYRYDTDGFKSLIAALQESGILAAVRDRRMNLSITSDTGVLVKQGTEDGRYTWFVEAPIELKLAGQTSEMPPQRFKATIRVARSSTLDNIEAIQVVQIVTTPMTN